ncbi:MAG: Septum formation initiator [Solirubrobacterales bacterium]|nr:Septum formation initiator [Solirubrobacterales bacterium]
MQMPQAYAERPRARRQATPARPRARPSAPAGAASAPRVRWDRIGRLAMLFVLAALLYLYLSAGLHMYSTWGQSRHDNAAVASLQREHRVLLRQHEALARQGTTEAQARLLGMKRANERQYEISGLPPN